MRTSTFNLQHLVFGILLIFGINYFGFSQTITGGCDKVTVNTIPSYPNNYYIGNFPTYGPCGVLVSIQFLAGIRMDLEKFNYSTNQWQLELNNYSTLTAPFEFDGLSPGRYRVLMFKPKLRFKSGCPDNKVKAFDYAHIWVGWAGVYSGTPDYTSNDVWVGEADISSGDASFNNYGYNPTAFDSGQVVRVNLTSNPRWSHWRGVIRDEQTLEQYETGWLSVDNNPGPFEVSSVWLGDAFKSLHTYKATIWVNNQQCIAWEPLDMPFFICPQGTGCKLSDQELSISFYPNPATDHIVLQGLDHIHKGDRMEATIMDGLGKVVKRIPHLQKRQMSVSELTSGLYYLSVFRNQNRISTEKLIIQ